VGNNKIAHEYSKNSHSRAIIMATSEGESLRVGHNGSLKLEFHG
jgi:hypothetical protein